MGSDCICQIRFYQMCANRMGRTQIIGVEDMGHNCENNPELLHVHHPAGHRNTF